MSVKRYKAYLDANHKVQTQRGLACRDDVSNVSEIQGNKHSPYVTIEGTLELELLRRIRGVWDAEAL